MMIKKSNAHTRNAHTREVSRDSRSGRPKAYGFVRETLWPVVFFAFTPLLLGARGCDYGTVGSNVVGNEVCLEDESGTCVTDGDACAAAGKACAADQFCQYSREARCGSAESTPSCAAKPEACTREYAPVCGCNGETYGNECEAHAAGVSVSHDGECFSGCTKDAKECPDGSTVGREGPDCEFALCPGEEPTVCTDDAMECPDGSFVARKGPDCKFAPCPDEGIACTKDLKICPDGSSVARSGPDCAFAPCPHEGTGCTKDLKICPDGSSVARSGPDCEFAPCP
jgi:hypothetical protein